MMIGDLITGNTFYLTQHFGAQMKIFKVYTNGTLERFQTIEPEFIPGTEIWQTPITDSYTSGTYIAAIKFRGEFTYSNPFTSNLGCKHIRKRHLKEGFYNFSITETT